MSTLPQRSSNDFYTSVKTDYVMQKHRKYVCVCLWVQSTGGGEAKGMRQHLFSF